MKTTATKTAKNPFTPSRGNVTSNDPRKATITAALRAKSGGSKVTLVKETAAGVFTGHCLKSASRNGRKTFASLGTFTVTLPELAPKAKASPFKATPPSVIAAAAPKRRIEIVDVETPVAEIPAVKAAMAEAARFVKAEKKAAATVAHLARVAPNTSELQDAKLAAAKAASAKRAAAANVSEGYAKAVAEAGNTPEKKETARLVTALMAKGVSVGDIAKAIGTSPGAVYMMKKGIRATKNLAALLAMATGAAPIAALHTALATSVNTGTIKVASKKQARAYAKLLGVSAAELEAAGQLTFIW